MNPAHKVKGTKGMTDVKDVKDVLQINLIIPLMTYQKR